MPQTVKGVVARAKGEPVTIENVVIPDPGAGEAVVRIQACGVCHTDLHYREGGINDDFPFLLGHEAAGVVEAVGRVLEGGDHRQDRHALLERVHAAGREGPAVAEPLDGEADPLAGVAGAQEVGVHGVHPLAVHDRAHRGGRGLVVDDQDPTCP